MKTIIVNVPDKDENLILSLLKKFRFKTKALTNEDLEDEALAKWINEGMKSEDVPEEEIFDMFRKHGIKNLGSTLNVVGSPEIYRSKT